MPEIARFYGIVIRMYYRDHAPPHFHAVYAGQDAVIKIADLSVLTGSLPPRALGLVIEWASRHQSELRSNWDRATRLERLVPISPLD